MFPLATDYIDDKNITLYNKISDRFIISVLYHELLDYRVTVLKDSIIVMVPETEICNASFTHELLHADMKIRNIVISDLLYNTWEKEDLIIGLWPKTLFGHIGNCMEHIKMLPLYLDLGYEREKFLQDYHEPKCTENEIRVVELLIQSPDIETWKYAVEMFIAKYFAIKACPNRLFDYKNYLGRLQSCNINLYGYCETLWNNWLSFKVELFSNDDDQSQMIEKFTDSLKSFILKKTVAT